VTNEQEGSKLHIGNRLMRAARGSLFDSGWGRKAEKVVASEQQIGW
jgi:hypothetical protein